MKSLMNIILGELSKFEEEQAYACKVLFKLKLIHEKHIEIDVAM